MTPSVLLGVCTGALERNLIPATSEFELPKVVQAPVRLSASGVAFPHPDKVSKGHMKGVNQKGHGYAGEDSYFYCRGRYVMHVLNQDTNICSYSPSVLTNTDDNIIFTSCKTKWLY